MPVRKGDIIAELIRQELRERGHEPEGLLTFLREQEETRTALLPLHERLPDYALWLQTVFPRLMSRPLADHHREFWAWVWGLTYGVEAPPFIGIWPRGHGKSSSGEAAVVAVGARQSRRYVVIVRETQDQADESVANIKAHLTAPEVGEHYPLLADAKVSAEGHKLAWRRDRLITASGFVVDGMGIDTAKRGARVIDQRPDLILLDDIDGRHDTPAATQKKLDILKDSILPMAAKGSTILGLQNLIIPHGIFSRLADLWEEEADFLQDRFVSGPHPAVRNPVVVEERDELGRIRQRLTGGQPTWAGMDLEACNAEIRRFGWPSFVREMQNEVGDRKGALWSRELLGKTRWLAPMLKAEWTVVSIDPAANTGQTGITVVAGAVLGDAIHTWTLADYSTPRGSLPDYWGSEAVRAYAEWGADEIVAETNQGGKMVHNTIKTIQAQGDLPSGKSLPFAEVRAGTSKFGRANPVAARMAEGLDHHVGVLEGLEAQMCRWLPGEKSGVDRIDSKVWGVARVLERLEAGLSKQRTDIALPGGGGQANQWRVG